MAGALTLVMIVFPPTFIFNGAISQGLWKYGLGLGIFSIVIPSIAFTIGIPKIGSGLATILGAAELPVTTIMSVFVLKEAVLSSQWLGVASYFGWNCNSANCVYNARPLSKTSYTQESCCIKEKRFLI